MAVQARAKEWAKRTVRATSTTIIPKSPGIKEIRRRIKARTSGALVSDASLVAPGS